jgi:hypothetical protein
VLLVACLIAQPVWSAPRITQETQRLHAQARSSCGVERWKVKTLADANAKQVRLFPRSSTVRALRTLERPPALPPTRITGAETTSYRVVAALREMKIEEDGDVHLVIADRVSGGTMIVEFPRITCTSTAATKLKKLRLDARAALIRACGQPNESSFTRLTGSATITGVGFFDFLHGQRGVAPNGFELHPVLRFTARSCTTSP